RFQAAEVGDEVDFPSGVELCHALVGASLLEDVDGRWHIVRRRMALDVRPVASKRDLATFIKLPWRLYRNEPLWVPPLIAERKRFLDRTRNPWFQHGEAEYFLAWRDGRAVGRITAQVDTLLNEFQGNRWGLFGFFECEDDPEAAKALFDAAEAWLRERGR